MHYQYNAVYAIDQPNRPRGLADVLGVFLSQLCLAHCFLLPIVLAVLSIDLHSIPGGEALHFVILILSTPTAIYALAVGRKFHGKIRPVAVGGIGLGLLWLGSTFDLAHFLMPHTIAHGIGALGSLGLIFAHLDNRHLARTLTPCSLYHRHPAIARLATRVKTLS